MPQKSNEKMTERGRDAKSGEFIPVNKAKRNPDKTTWSRSRKTAVRTRPSAARTGSSRSSVCYAAEDGVSQSTPFAPDAGGIALAGWSLSLAVGLPDDSCRYRRIWTRQISETAPRQVIVQEVR